MTKFGLALIAAGMAGLLASAAPKVEAAPDQGQCDRAFAALEAPYESLFMAPGEKAFTADPLTATALNRRSAVVDARRVCRGDARLAKFTPQAMRARLAAVAKTPEACTVISGQIEGAAQYAREGLRPNKPMYDTDMNDIRGAQELRTDYEALCPGHAGADAVRTQMDAWASLYSRTLPQAARADPLFNLRMETLSKDIARLAQTDEAGRQNACLPLEGDTLVLHTFPQYEPMIAPALAAAAEAQAACASPAAFAAWKARRAGQQACQTAGMEEQQALNAALAAMQRAEKYACQGVKARYDRVMAACAGQPQLAQMQSQLAPLKTCS